MANWWEDNDLNNTVADLERDEREGNHTVVVRQTDDPKEWDGGGTSYSCTCEIETAGFAKMYASFGKPSTAEELKAAKEAASDSDSRRRAKAMAFNTRTAMILAKDYGLEDVAEIGPGFRFAAKLVKNKKGWIRVAAVLPKAKMAGETVGPTDETPF